MEMRSGKNITIFSDVAGDYFKLDSFESDFRKYGKVGYPGNSDLNSRLNTGATENCRLCFSRLNNLIDIIYSQSKSAFLKTKLITFPVHTPVCNLSITFYKIKK